MKHVIKNMAKLVLSGATVFGIGFYFVTTAPAPESPLAVQEASADIAWFGVGKDGHEFTRAMMSAGLEPRPYDLNGNVMYFASGKVDRTPAEVERELQKIFVTSGVNKKNHAGALTNEELSRRGQIQSKEQATSLFQSLGESDISKAMLDGDVVPVSRNARYVAMSGVDYGKDAEELLKDLEEGKIKKLTDMAPQGYRFVEATYEPHTGLTDIHAVWTAKEFDPKKMNNTAFKPQEPDLNVPVCMGCERQVRFQSLSQDEPYRSNRWNTNMSLHQTYNFYRQSMANRGWRESGAQDKLDRLYDEGLIQGPQGKILNLEKDGQAMQIVLLTDGMGGTMVMSQERYQGAESTIPVPK